MLMLEGAKLDLLDTMLRVGVLVAACLVFTVAQRFLSRQHVFHSRSDPKQGMVLTVAR